jgi:hypothetical protein
VSPVKFMEEETSRPTSPSVGDDDSDGNLIVDVEGLARPSTPPSGSKKSGRRHLLNTSKLDILGAVGI